MQILESTNSLISLRAEVSDPLYFLGVVRGSLERFLLAHPADHADDLTSSVTSTNGNGTESEQIWHGEKARASGYLFGLNAMGMCILKLPREVVEIEGRRVGSLIMGVSPLLILPGNTMLIKEIFRRWEVRRAQRVRRPTRSSSRYSVY